jgi:RNA exonuclease 1
MNHSSVGTELELAKREEDRKKLESLKITVSHLEPYILSQDELRQWSYIVEVPDGPGGDRPSEEGSIMKCERCSQQFKVKRRAEADECIFHWGKQFSSKANGSFPPSL